MRYPGTHNTQGGKPLHCVKGLLYDDYTYNVLVATSNYEIRISYSNTLIYQQQ